MDDYGIRCWGAPAALALVPAGGFSAISAGKGHTCAINKQNQQLECWGDNSYDQSNAPTGTFLAVAAGGQHTCAIEASPNPGTSQARTSALRPSCRWHARCRGRPC